MVRDSEAAGGGGPRLLHDLLDGAAAEVPDRVAVRDISGEMTYARLARSSLAFAHWLRRRGVEPGQRLVVQLPSTKELVAMLYGASRAGVVFVPLNPAMRQFHLASVFANAEPALAIADGERAEAMRGLAGSVPVDEFDSVWGEVSAPAAGDLAPPPAVPEPDDIAVLIYTSGSTAAPKAVIGSHAPMVFATDALQQVLGYRGDDVVFCRFPLSWDYGLYKVLLCSLSRCQIVLAGNESDLLLLRRMAQTGTTIVPIVPSLAGMIVTLAPREARLPRVRMFTNTGAALHTATIEALRKWFPGTQVVRQFGQTECKRISIMPPEADGERPDSVGRPLPGTQVFILGPDGELLPPGEVGEIVAAGPHVMPGYWRSPEMTARSFRTDPATGLTRLHTGDYGWLDTDGYLYFEGRRDDMFKRKGIRMSTLEIEAAAVDIPGVHRAAVLPPTDAYDLALFVESDLAPHTVLKGLAERLEPAKVPATCRVLTELPRTLHGKHSRQALAALLVVEPGEEFAEPGQEAGTA